MSTVLHPEETAIADVVYDGDGLLACLGAVVRQAIHDFYEERHETHHMQAKDFLSACGMIDAAGHLDLHGHTVVLRTYFTKEER